LVEAPVQIFMPGGELTLRYVGANLLMRGSATQVFDGEIEL
jgi:diaminopimelate epimerase